jgi:hypothetical protein
MDLPAILTWVIGLPVFLFVLWCMPPIRGFFTDGAKALKLWFSTNKTAQAVVSTIVGMVLGIWLARGLIHLIEGLK